MRWLALSGLIGCALLLSQVIYDLTDHLTEHHRSFLLFPALVVIALAGCLAESRLQRLLVVAGTVVVLLLSRSDLAYGAANAIAVLLGAVIWQVKPSWRPRMAGLVAGGASYGVVAFMLSLPPLESDYAEWYSMAACAFVAVVAAGWSATTPGPKFRRVGWGLLGVLVTALALIALDSATDSTGWPGKPRAPISGSSGAVEA